ncbi:hypothetical protein MNV84_02771 [Leishmania braziliensis]|nr:hypothetical protein MNV84_02771 [Leishmania braziliensis]
MQSSALPAGPSLDPQQPAGQRQIVPLRDNGATVGDTVIPQLSAGTPGTVPRKASYTANLEAQVRVLEKEVHLLRAGLEQNEKLGRVSEIPASLQRRSSASPSSRQVHFGPSSVVMPSPTPQPTSTSSAAVTEVNSRPRLVFGQRVNPTHSRISAHGPSNADPWQTRRSRSFVKPSRTRTRAGPAPSSSTTPATSTTSVQLSPAHASLRGGNTNGIPLQGAATGGTLVSPVAADTQPAAASPAGSSSAPSAAATVWASADPRLLWPRAATAAAGTLVSASELSQYPFRTTTTSSPAAASRLVTSDAPAASSAPSVRALVETAGAAASPIEVAMSSDGPPLASLTQPAMPATSPAAEATPFPAAAPAVLPASSPPALYTAHTVTHPLSRATVPPPSVAAAASSTDASAVPPEASASSSAPATVAQREAEALALRDTLAQRDALLHRLLLVLHDQNDNVGARRQRLPEKAATSPLLRQDAGAAVAALEESERQQSRKAMRFLAEELFAVQTQLSHARTSHQLVVAELHTCRQQVHQASLQQQQLAAIPEKASPDGMSQPSSGSLQEQLDVALKKLKAWEDWYATSATAAGDGAIGVAACNSNALPSAKDASYPPQQLPQSKMDNTEKQTGVAAPAAASRGPQEKKRSHKREKRVYGAPTSGWCPHCGFGLPGLSPVPATSDFPPHYASLSSPSVPVQQGPPAVTPPAPYVSAYALNSILYNRLTNQGGGSGIGANGNVDAEPEVADKASGKAATPSPPPPLEAAPSSSPAQPTETHGKSKDARASEKAHAGTGHQSSRAGVCGASPMWAVPMSGASVAGAAGVGGAFHKRAMNTAFLGGGAASDPSLSLYCDRLDHAQQQAYRTQQYVTQLAREAAVRELAEAERQVAEQRLALWEHRHSYAGSPSAVPSTPPFLAPCSATPDGLHSAEVGRQEVVE